MKVVGLISGGKDSIFNLMQCVEHEHEIVAVANLKPENEDIDELDSYMYQTVGHRCIESVAECLNVPLFRRTTSGKMVNEGLSYKETAGDEVEDLFLLLKEVKKQFPGLKGVSSGAVLSTYQKNRVENICDRLGLVSLAYLWESDQAKLLERMTDSGMKAIFVKTACIGLNPNEYLGKYVDEKIPSLEILNKKFGINVAGEGGEYETLTLDCPLYKRRIIIPDSGKSIVITDDDGSGMVVGHLRIHNVETVEK